MKALGRAGGGGYEVGFRTPGTRGYSDHPGGQAALGMKAAAGGVVEDIVQETGVRNGAYGADKFGFKELAAVHWNLTEPALYEHAVAAGEAIIVAGGALCAETGHHTGRSPKDKHTVVDALTEKSVWWDGNRKMSKEHFDALYRDFLAHAKGKKLFAQDLYGGADPNYRIKTRVFTELAWHSLFIRTLLIRPERCRACKLRARTDHRRPAVVPARRQTPRRPRRLRHDGRDRFRPQDRADLRHVLTPAR